MLQHFCVGAKDKSDEFWKATKVISKQDSYIPTLWDIHFKADLLNRYFLDCFNNYSFPPLRNPTPVDPTGCPDSILCTEEELLNPAKFTGLDGVQPQDTHTFLLQIDKTSSNQSLQATYKLCAATITVVMGDF